MIEKIDIRALIRRPSPRRILAVIALASVLALEFAAAGVDVYDLAHTSTYGIGDIIEFAEVCVGMAILLVARH